MRAVAIVEPGGPEVLQLVQRADPEPGPTDLLVAVRATAVNRADILQRRGYYPPPPGASDLPGLELAGEVVTVGPGTEGFSAGDQVCAIVSGGAYAELAVVPAVNAMPLPPGVDIVAAGAVPEVFATAWDNLVRRARLTAGEVALIHGGASGVGTAAIQLARLVGATPYVTAGSAERVAACVALGAAGGIDYREREDFDAALRELTGGRGADVILDVMGAPYLERNLAALEPDGRVAVIGLQGGASATLDLGALMGRRASVLGSTMRARSVSEKAAVARDLVEHVWPAFGDGRLRPVVDRVLPLAEAAEAHRVVEASQHIGKVVLVP